MKNARQRGLRGAALLAFAVTGCGGDGAARDGTAIASISVEEAPLPTGTLFWGHATTTAPQFYIDPNTKLILNLGHAGQVQYMGLDHSFLPGVTFGDGPSDFPQSGTKHLVGHPFAFEGADVTVEPAVIEGSPEAPTRIVRSFRVEAQQTAQTDITVSLDAKWTGNGYAATLTASGTFRSVTVDLHAEASVAEGRQERAGEKAKTWRAPMMLDAPGFYGPPMDTLTLTFDDQGVPQSYGFEAFFRTDTLPRPQCENVTTDATVPPTSSHFVFRFRCTEAGAPGYLGTDAVEGLEGDKVDGVWRVRYFVRGVWRAAKVDAHAFGTLSPVDP